MPMSLDDYRDRVESGLGLDGNYVPKEKADMWFKKELLEQLQLIYSELYYANEQNQ